MVRHMRALFVIVLALAVWGAALPALAQTATPINIGDTVEGSLTTTQPQARYTFTGEAGQVIVITLISNAFDAYLTLEDANGMFVASDDDGGGGGNARIGPLALPASGSFVIIATSLFGTETGAYSLKLATPQVSDSMLQFGDVVEDELTSSELVKTYYFEAQAGDAVIISLKSTALDAYLELRSPTGASTWTDDDSGGDRNSLLGPLVLPEEGLYVINATSFGRSSTGPFTLSLKKVELTPLTFDTPVTVNLVAGEPLYFTFEGASSQIVDLRVDSGNTVDTLLVLRDPDGYQIAENDDFTGIDPALTEITLYNSGTYTVLLQGRYPDESGPLTVTLRAANLPSLDEGPQRVRLSDKQSTGRLVFNGVAGETVTLTIALESGEKLPSYIDITQGGTSVAYLSSDALTALTLTLVVPQDGVVVVELNDYSYTVKILTLTLERAAAN